MSADQCPSHPELLEFSDQVIQVAVRAEEILREVGRMEDNEVIQEAPLREAYDQCLVIEEQLRAFSTKLELWQAQDLPIAQRSEADWAATKLGRLDVVTRNTSRICRRLLEIPDPEREQAEMMLMLNTMNIDVD